MTTLHPLHDVLQMEAQKGARSRLLGPGLQPAPVSRRGGGGRAHFF